MNSSIKMAVLALGLWSTFAWAQAGQTPRPEEPPANGPTRITSPLASDPVRSWQDATRNRTVSQLPDGTAGPSTPVPASGRSGAANTRVTLPSCQDPSAANFGGMGRCIHIPAPVIVPPPNNCFGPSTQTVGMMGACPPGYTGGRAWTSHQSRECVNGSWTGWVETSRSAGGDNCVPPPPVVPPPPPPTCQDPAATNFGGPLPCEFQGQCDLMPGSPDCCLQNPGHASCGRFNCEMSSGQEWDANTGTCHPTLCGMPRGWTPCGNWQNLERWVLPGGEVRWRCVGLSNPNPAWNACP